MAQYESGHFAEAAQQLESLVREVPQSFEVQELLGLAYSAQSQDAKASQHLANAVRLKPDSASARTNLAANLMRLGKFDLAGAIQEGGRARAGELRHQPQSGRVLRPLGKSR